MITELTAPNAKAEPTVRVRITAPTVITRQIGGKHRGVEGFPGSVLDVTKEESLLLFSSFKAERVGSDVPIKNVEKPKAVEAETGKAK